jgi:hypothetical protein
MEAYAYVIAFYLYKGMMVPMEDARTFNQNVGWGMSKEQCFRAAEEINKSTSDQLGDVLQGWALPRAFCIPKLRGK